VFPAMLQFMHDRGGRTFAVDAAPGALGAGGASAGDREAIKNGTGRFAAVEEEAAVRILGRPLAVDHTGAGAILGADRDGLAAEVDVAVAGADVGAVEHEHRVAVPGGIDRLLNGIEGMLCGAVLLGVRHIIHIDRCPVQRGEAEEVRDPAET
jgi:hypothetical protein